jgi:hypothetical protein
MSSLAYEMARRGIECNCNRSVTNFRSVKIEINDSIIELECNICSGLVGWWHCPTRKIMPLKQKWSREESTAITADSAFATKYDKNQALSQANACGNGELPLNVGCQNIGSQVQGDENAVGLAADQVFPGFGDEEDPKH